MRCLIWLAVVGCARSAPSSTTIRDDAPTPLQIVVLDDYRARESCEDTVPRKVEVLFDGTSAGVVEIPCRTRTAMPPPQIAGPTVTLSAGKHRVVARELGVGNSVEREVDLPVIVESTEDGSEQLATKLPVLVSDDEIDVAAPRVTITFESE